MKTQLFIIMLLFLIWGGMLHAQSQSPQLWGMTQDGGLHSEGTIFKMNLDGSNFASVYSFSNATSGEFPHGSLIKASNGLLYGMVTNGGFSIGGVLFSFNPVSYVYTVLVNFDGTNGSFPNGNLLQASNGLLYGMTTSGGFNGQGVLFSFNTANNQFTKLIDFYSSSSGSYPNGTLMQASNGLLYGLTSHGGFADAGALFSFNTTNNLLTKYDLYDSGPGRSDPLGNLIQNGSFLYGTASEGRTCNQGTVFTFNINTNSFSSEMQFCGSQSDFGAFPNGSLVTVPGIPATKFYGMTNSGGTSGNGVIFSFDTQTIIHATQVTFDGANNGKNPFGSLIKASDGKLYGTTYFGGLNNIGVVFRLDPSSNTLLKLHDFTNISGSAEGFHIRGDLLEVACTAAPSAPGTISVTSGSASVCDGDVSTFSFTNVQGVTYNWTAFTGASITSGQGTNSISVTFNSSFTTSTGIIQVIATNSCGTSPANTITITKSAPILSNPITVSGGSDKVCPGDNLSYSITSVTGWTYNWTAFTGATITSGQGTSTITVNYTSAFTPGTLSVTATNLCGTSAPVNFTVLRNTPATPSVMTGASTVCHGITTTYSITAVSGMNYSWTLPAGATHRYPLMGSNISVVFGTTGGNITVTASNGCGVSGVRSKAVVVNCREADAEQMQEEVSAEVFPNPTNGRVTLKFSSDANETCGLVIGDITGRIVKQEQILASEGVNEHIVDMSNLVKGIYFLKMKTTAGEFTKRVVKE